jgi:hypothetical protein
MVAAGIIAGCGGSSDNGVASKSPDQIVSSAENAIDGAQSAHVYGRVSGQGAPVTLDLHLVSGKGGEGTMSESGLPFRIIVVGQQVYINGSPAFWRHFGGSAAAELFNGKWLSAPVTGQLASLAPLTNLHELASQALSHHGTLTKGQTTTIGSQKVVPVHDTSQGGTLYVATTGPAYPIEIAKPGNQLNFDQFNAKVSLQAPANAINLSQLQG